MDLHPKPHYIFWKKYSIFWKNYNSFWKILSKNSFFGKYIYFLEKIFDFLEKL